MKRLAVILLVTAPISASIAVLSLSSAVIATFAVTFVVLAITSLIVTAHKRANPRGRSWSEEVRLSSGETIVVKRSEKDFYTDMGVWRYGSGRLEAELPGAGKVVWDTTLKPWLLDKANDGTWYVVGRFEDEFTRGGHDYGLKTGQFAAFRLVGSEWQRMRDGFPSQFSSPNLLVESYNIFHGDSVRVYDGQRYGGVSVTPISEGGLLELAMKEKINFPSESHYSWSIRVTPGDLGQAPKQTP